MLSIQSSPEKSNHLLGNDIAVPQLQLSPTKINTTVQIETVDEVEPVKIVEETSSVVSAVQDRLSELVLTSKGQQALRQSLRDEAKKKWMTAQASPETLVKSLKSMAFEWAESETSAQIASYKLKQNQAQIMQLERVQQQNTTLQALCRSLQTENKRLKLDLTTWSEREQFNRNQMSEKLESSLKDIRARIDADAEDKERRAEEAEKLKHHLEILSQQNEAREKHVEAVLKKADLETQLLQAQLAQQQALSAKTDEHAKMLMEQLTIVAKREAEAQQRLQGYADQFEGIEKTLKETGSQMTQYRELLLQQKQQIMEMEKKIMLLNKEKTASLLVLEETKTALIKEQESRQRLEALCRALQKRNSAE